MIKGLHHIGIAVRNLYQAANFYEHKLGIKPLREVEWPGLKAALIPLGNTIIEIIQPVGEPQTRVAASLTQIVEERGGGIHHFAFVVDDIDSEVALLRDNGVGLIDETPQVTSGGKVAWLCEDTMDYVMIELCEEGYEIS